MDFKVTVAILNWNGLKHLQQFLPNVLANSREAKVVLIDNASTDGSAEWVHLHHPEASIIQLKENLGFTGGYNAAMVQMETPFTVLLNSDVEVTENWLAPLIQRMESDPNIAACQPKIRSLFHRDTFEYAGACGGFLDILGYPYCRGRIFETCEKDMGQYNQAVPAFWASGACMMVRTQLFLEAGGFESRFFAHMEEIELCWRFWEKGHSVWVEPSSLVFHLGAGTLAKTSPRKTLLNYRNGLAMLFMHSQGPGVFWKVPLRLILDGIAGLRYLAHGEWENCLAISKAHMEFYQGFRYWSKKRNANLKGILPPPIVWTPGSIVHAYFLKGKKRFSDLAN